MNSANDNGLVIPDNEPLFNDPLFRTNPDDPLFLTIPDEPLVWWPDEVVGVPCPFLRSALFSISPRRKGEQLSFFQQPIFASHGITIEFSGFQLNQADLDVWLAVLNASRYRENSVRGVSFWGFIQIPSIREFLRDMGRKESGADIKLFMESITRLQSAVIKVENGKYGFNGNLIGGVLRKNGEFWIKLDIGLARLFGKSGWTAVEVEQRRKLQKFPLAQWLHGFYSSHRNSTTYLYSIEKIRGLCGSCTNDLYGFKRDVKKALEKIASATGWMCRVRDDNRIEVIKTERREVLIDSKS